MTSGDKGPYLDDLRERIDAIDGRICDLLRERMDIVREVGERKSAANIAGSFIRSGREAEMLRRLSERMEGVLPAASVARIWRAIIVSSLNAERAFRLYTQARPSEAYWLAREYFSGIVPITECAAAEEVIEHARTDICSVGVLPAGGDAPLWWLRPPQEKNNLFVFACVPFVEEPGAPFPDMFAFANLTPGTTEEDATLLAFDRRGADLAGKKTPAEAVRAVTGDAPYKIHADMPQGALLSAKGAVTAPHCAALQEAAGCAVRLIGRYATPVPSGA